MTTVWDDTELDRLTRALAGHGVDGVDLAFVLGSGLGAFADRLENATRIPYAQLAGMPESSVAGHAGQLVVGEIGGARAVVQQGRVHLYEGRTPGEVTRAVRAFATLGARAVVLTNAAGGLRPEWPAGTLMRLTDHVNMQGRTPLATDEGGYGSPYDPELGAALDAAAKQAGVTLERGVYAGLLGPTYETPAEIRMLGSIGVDAVGMSTVLEALAAHASGARVAAISLVTNLAAGIHEGALSHAEVVDAGREASSRFCDLLLAAAPLLAAATRGR